MPSFRAKSCRCLMFNRVKSQSGFTLVELMVVVGVIAVLAIGFASYLYQQTRQQQAGQARENIGQVQANVLSASGKSDVLIQSENLQIQQLGSSNHTSCRSPCWIESGNCIFRCGDPGHPESNYCPSQLPSPCVYVSH